MFLVVAGLQRVHRNTKGNCCSTVEQQLVSIFDTLQVKGVFFYTKNPRSCDRGFITLKFIIIDKISLI